jgi:hypothetical protein
LIAACSLHNKENMGKKSSKRRKQGRATNQPGEAALQYAFDGLPKDEKMILSLMDRLFQSHAELCTALRLAGRQLLRVEEQGAEPLEKIRKVLKRADHVRKALVRLNEWPETLEHMHESVVTSAAEYSQDGGTEDVAIRKSAQKRNSPGRGHSPRVIRFPSA